MEYNIKTNKNFTTAFNKMKEKYGEEFEKMNGLAEKNLSYGDFIDAFVDSNTVADATIDGSANVSGKDICSLDAEMSKSQKKLLAFNKIFYEMNKKYGLSTAREWLEGEWNGSLYLHDAPSATFLPYCFAYDLDELVEKGLFFIGQNFNSQAPKHLMTYTRDVLEFVSWTSNRTSGACGLPSFLIYSYYFWMNDVKNNYFLVSPEYYRQQSFQEIIYGLNQPYLRVNQSAFTNFSIFDRHYLIEMFGGRTFPNGDLVIDHIEGIMEHQKSFMRANSRIRSENMFTFPVLSFSLLFQKEKFVDETFARWCSDHNWEWNDSNFFNGPDITSLSSCCRLINDFSKLDGFINSIGGTSLKIGSVKVNTINLMRIAYESETEKEYLSKLVERTHLCIKTLDIIRGIIKRNIEKGLLPNYTHGLIDINNQYNTIGINALYEAIQYFGYIEEDEFGNYSYSDKGLIFASKIMDTINEVKDSYKFDYSINVEAVPAERCAVVLCAKDNALYPNENNHTLYSNQWIPLTKKCSIKEKLRLGAILDVKCGGGQITHINIEGRFPNKDMAWEMLNKIAKAGVIYFAFNTKISVCKYNHGFMGEICPTCGGPVVDTYQRVVGFLTPWSTYTKERKVETKERNYYDIPELF